MTFEETPLRGVFVIGLEPFSDERGFFGRTWCRREFDAHGLDASVAQCNVSFNARAGTLRGLHFQAAPHEEIKLVRCVAGAIFDVVVDLRPESPTFRGHFTVTLSAQNRRSLYIPGGFAHGFQTLEDDSVLQYHISAAYHPDSGFGIHWDDPTLAIPWPIRPPTVISSRDNALPRL